jgi:hypothetical protein
MSWPSFKGSSSQEKSEDHYQTKLSTRYLKEIEEKNKLGILDSESAQEDP